MDKSVTASAGDMGSFPGLGGFHVPQRNKSLCNTTFEPTRLEPMLCNKRSHRNEKPTLHDKEQPLLTARKPVHSNDNPAKPKINK